MPSGTMPPRFCFRIELNKYSYAPNLAAVRYLIDANGDDFWNASLYNSWLNGIRSLNPPIDVSGFRNACRLRRGGRKK